MYDDTQTRTRRAVLALAKCFALPAACIGWPLLILLLAKAIQ